MTQSRTLARLLAAVGAAVVALALLAPLASAADTETRLHPVRRLSQPNRNTDDGSVLPHGGHRRELQDGQQERADRKTVPAERRHHFGGQVAATAKGGLEVVKQKVPGGVIGLTGLTWLAEFLGIEALTLYAATELPAPPATRSKKSIKLPIKVHLINAALGNNCYVGSVTNPINLNLITGTTAPPPPNKPITGKEGDLQRRRA